MKKGITLILLVFSLLGFSQSFEISTLRIGDFKIFMDKTSADKIANKSLKKDADYDNPNKINYNGETVEVLLFERYINESQPEISSVYLLRTKSPKFKTKSAMGVGNTREELIQAYKNYSNFSMSSYKDPDNKETWKESYFMLNDNDAGTYLQFKLVDNIVVQVQVSLNEGC